ncbi:MAG TPA: phosphatase PAP2 family protein [Saprospiraceae bacterium]|mgnify:CR=1 FL=1|nr:inositol phosphorylceramide synthase [Saprospiraceae bacterium]MCB9328257.1 inositol phosphorylceramide synthase [Lewinellaceae bacterium]HPK09633.1 phosphatase PAP2 family protein [Saprospiraceae bacterium]HPQ22033.1 phosphatase PAP2 family protein [Saprospiraceae bacterium]HRX29458.1 phosphatase PAP2 family protein [Saprospiraceae bacterium]
MKSDFFNLNFDKTTTYILLVFTVVYAFITIGIVGFRIDHLYFYLLLVFLYTFHPLTRKMVLSFVFFIIFWIIYDSMRAFPNYLFNTVHIEEPYLLEKSLFGINYMGKILTPNEYFLLNSNKILDFISGIAYLSWVPVPLMFSLLLFFKDRLLMLNFTMVFLLTNLLGFILYYSYPAAPPWYFEAYGLVEKFNIPGNAAQLVNFDKLVGMDIFSNLYTKNSNVFAAIPSLHAAYPLVTFYFSLKKGYKLISILLFCNVIGIWFSAVYSFHHYVLDVLLGILCAFVALLIYNFLILNHKPEEELVKYNQFIDRIK